MLSPLVVVSCNDCFAKLGVPRTLLPGGATSVVWTADFLPDELHAYFSQAIGAGMAAMQRSLDALAA